MPLVQFVNFENFYELYFKLILSLLFLTFLYAFQARILCTSSNGTITQLHYHEINFLERNAEIYIYNVFKKLCVYCYAFVFRRKEKAVVFHRLCTSKGCLLFIISRERSSEVTWKQHLRDGLRRISTCLPRSIIFQI